MLSDGELLEDPDRLSEVHHRERQRERDAQRAEFAEVARVELPAACPVHTDYACIGLVQNNGLCVFGCAIDNGHVPTVPSARSLSLSDIVEAAE